MKRFTAGLIIGIIIAFAIGATASSNIRLVINGNEIETDVPPQMINGRVMVPARYIAEPLGAKVEWDEKNNAIIITDNNESKQINSINEDLIHGKELHDTYGITITVVNPKDNPPKFTLSKGEKIIETTEYYEINGMLYFKRNILNLFLTQ